MSNTQLEQVYADVASRLVVSGMDAVKTGSYVEWLNALFTGHAVIEDTLAAVVVPGYREAIAA